MGDDATEDRCGGWVLRAELDPDGQAGKNFRSSPGQLRRSSPRRPHIYTSESYIRSDPYSCKLASNLQMGDRRLISPGTRPMSDVRRPAFSGCGSTSSPSLLPRRWAANDDGTSTQSSPPDHVRHHHDSTRLFHANDDRCWLLVDVGWVRAGRDGGHPELALSLREFPPPRSEPRCSCLTRC